MPEILASIALAGLAVYGAAGIIVAIHFVVRGSRDVDPAVLHAGLGFRLLIGPGLVALWPWVALRVRRAREGRHDA